LNCGAPGETISRFPVAVVDTVLAYQTFCTVQMEKVSVIIPTRNRKESLYRTLTALSKQKAAVHEVIIIDSSDIPTDSAELKNKFSFHACSLVQAEASVCVQRNEGIRRATGDFVFLLDDDISVDENYIPLCLAFFDNHPAALVVSGLVVEKNKSGNWNCAPPRISFLKLAWNFVFQAGVWADPQQTKKTDLNSFLLKRIQGYYRRHGNGISKGGWPELTDFSQPCFRSQIYYLGASIIKRDWLAANLYTEKLDQHGIGDNYGIAIKLRPEQGVFILTEAYAYHHKSSDNRVSALEAYYKRVLALNYFSTVQASASKRWLVWSLVGNLLSACFHLQREGIVKNCRLIGILLLNRNRLLR
jgi:glycosyltransferase involved in cell wall biosynthesis